MTGMLAALTRPELDTLLAECEHAEAKAHIALAVAPLDRPESVYSAAGVAVDVTRLWMDALDESIGRLWAGRG
jgi:hypothetical protein